MDEKNKALLEALTDEQKEKLAASKTPEELTALLGELGVELPAELMEKIAGGYQWQTGFTEAQKKELEQLPHKFQTTPLFF